MDLLTGARLTSEGPPSSHFATACLYNAHSNIPRPLLVGAALTTSSVHACRTPVPESLIRLHSIPNTDTKPMGAVDPRIAQPTKRLASSSSRVNASDEKSSTIMTPVITASVERQLDGKEDHEAQQSPDATSPMVEDPRIRSPAAVCKDSGSTTEKAARSGRRAEGQTRTVLNRPELPEESATQNPRAIGPEERAILPTPNATPALGLDRRVDSTVVFPSPIDRSFDVLDSQKPKTGRACPDNSSEHHGAEERKEAASAQAVKRGPRVTMIEIPDQDDDTAYQQWLQKGSPTNSQKRKAAELPIPPDSENPPSPLPNEGVGPDLR